MKEKKRTIKSNKSLYFLLPMLGIMYSFYRNNIINSYISDKINRQNIDNFHIFVLVRARDEKFENMKTYKEYYKTEDGYMYVFKVPTQFEEDYLKFILGQYSQFSAEYKQKIIQLLPIPYTKSVIFKVITKSPEAKAVIEEKIGQSIGEQEVFSVPDMGDETYE